MKLEISYKLSEVENVAKQLINSLSSKIIILYGSMGVGKTTLIKSLVKELGSDDKVSSPTFSIANQYELNNDTIYHFDLYRIENLEEAYNFGIEDYLYSNKWFIVEWPEIIENIVPKPFDRIHLELNPDNSRRLKLNYTK